MEIDYNVNTEVLSTCTRKAHFVCRYKNPDSRIPERKLNLSIWENCDKEGNLIETELSVGVFYADRLRGTVQVPLKKLLAWLQASAKPDVIAALEELARDDSSLSGKCEFGEFLSCFGYPEVLEEYDKEMDNE